MSCDPYSINQEDGDCYFISVILLFKKLKCVYDLLPSDVQHFMRNYLYRPPPVRGKIIMKRSTGITSCMSLPVSVQRIYNSVCTMDLSTLGGHPLCLIHALFKSNRIMYTLQPIRWSTIKNRSESIAPSRFSVLLTPIFYKRRSVDKCMREIAAYAARFPVVRGGVLNLQSRRGAYEMHGYHTASFTMCDGQPLLCNWGNCAFATTPEAVNSVELDKFLVDQIILVCHDEDAPHIDRPLSKFSDKFQGLLMHIVDEIRVNSKSKRRRQSV